jgi:hypothetical protein
MFSCRVKQFAKRRWMPATQSLLTFYKTLYPTDDEVIGGQRPLMTKSSAAKGR